MVTATKKITCLAGGVGAARFLQGLAQVVPRKDVTVIINTGDDIELHGLHISPDLDIVTYSLAGVVDETKGWGIKDDTFNCLGMLQSFGCETWFKIGDKDMATHVYRTNSLKKSSSLTESTTEICQRLGVQETILPMTDDRFETRIRTDKGEVHFQEYMIKHMMRDRVIGVRFEGAEEAKPSPAVLDAISDASGIIVCPSNPIVSIGTILSVRGIREALRKAEAKVVAVSPIIGGTVVKGPAEELMRGLGIEVSAFSVANLYKDFLDVLILDAVDRDQKTRVESLGVRAMVVDTLMKTISDKVRLAKVALSCL